MAWLETDFRPGDPLHRIKARWLSEVANALNSLDVELHDDIAIPYVERPAYPGKWIIHLPAPGKGGGGAATPFNHRWRVTVADGETSRTLRIEPGSLWRNDGAGVVDLGVAPDGETVTVADDGAWTAQTSGSGSLYVVDASPAPLLVWGDPTSETRAILLRVADLVVASSGTTLVQRAVGDQLYSVGGGGSVDKPRFLEVRKMPRKTSSGAEEQAWWVFLGEEVNVSYPYKKTDFSNPWDYDVGRASIPKYAGDNGRTDGWSLLASASDLPAGNERAYYALEIYLPSIAPEHGGSPSYFISLLEDHINGVVYDAGRRTLSFVFAEASSGGVYNFRVGPVNVQVVASQACDLMVKRGGVWSAPSDIEQQEADDAFALVQWRCFRVQFFSRDYVGMLTTDVFLDDAMIGYNGILCAGHAEDHVDGTI